jgi:hypothetical protein
VRNASRKASSKGQANPRAFLRFALLAVSEGAKLILSVPKPAKRPGGFAFFRHSYSLALSPHGPQRFDPDMLVL